MKKSYQVEGLIWGWDRIPNFRSTAPINKAFHLYNFQSVGRGRWGGGGEGRWKGTVEGGRMGEGAKGEIAFYGWRFKMPNTNPALWAFSRPILNWVWDFTFQAHLKSCSNLLVKLVHKISLSASCSNCVQSIESLWYVREDWASTYWLQPF